MNSEEKSVHVENSRKRKHEGDHEPQQHGWVREDDDNKSKEEEEDDEIPIITFLNEVNMIGSIYQPDEFAEPKAFSSKDLSVQDTSVGLKTSVVMDVSEQLKPSLDLFSDKFKDDTNFNMYDLIKGILNPNSDDPRYKQLAKSFSSLVKDLGNNVQRVFGWLQKKKDETIYMLFRKEPINHISGNEWRNFGETLMNTPEYLFSDDTADPAGYLLYNDDESLFWLANARGEKIRDIVDDQFPRHFRSPISLEHLKAIVELAKFMNKKIKVFGCSHSWAPIHTTQDILVDNRMINTEKGKHIVRVNTADPRTDHPTISKKGELKPTATISPGITSGDFEKEIWKYGYSMEASTIEEVFTMAGICFTSSHGTGKKFTSSSDLLVGLTIVCSNGKVVEITPNSCVYADTQEPVEWLDDEGELLTPEDVWRAIQVNLGAFGIVYEMTVVVQKQMYALFVSEQAKWETYFGTDLDKSCENLAKLNDEWDTLEFWHYPLTIENVYHPTIAQLFKGKATYNPYFTITKTMTNELSEEQKKKYEVVDKAVDCHEFLKQLAFQSLGSGFFSSLWKFGVTLYKTYGFEELGKYMIRNMTLLAGWSGKLDWGREPIYNDQGELVKKGEVWRIPQWVANHPILDATAVVEPVPVLDIEWLVPIPNFDAKGFRNACAVYGDMIRAVKERFEKYDEYPVSVNVEMRFLRGSNSPLSMMYNHQPMFDSELGQNKLGKGWAAPEFITFSPNPWWEKFYDDMNQKITCYKKTKKKYGNNIRVHIAKQYASLKGMLKYMRGIWEDEKLSSYPHKTYNTSLKLWKEVRNRIDREGMFLNPFIVQFFIDPKDTYEKEFGHEVAESGSVKNNTAVNNCTFF